MGIGLAIGDLFGDDDDDEGTSVVANCPFSSHKLQVNLSSSLPSGVGVCRGVASVDVVGEDISDVGAGKGSTKEGVVNTSVVAAIADMA